MTADNLWLPDLSAFFALAADALVCAGPAGEGGASATGFREHATAVPFPAGVVDQDRRIVWANPSACAYLNVDAETLEGSKLTDIGVRVARATDPFLRASPEWVDVVGLGGVRHVLLRRMPLDDGTHGMLALDLSGVVNAALNLDEAETRFRSFMEHAPVAAVLKDEAGRYVWANPTYFDTYRIPPDNFLGTTVEDHLPLQAREQARMIELADRQVLEQGKPARATRKFTRPDGSTGTDVGWRFALPAGDGTKLLGEVFLDITESTSVKARLNAAEARYRDLFGHCGVAMVATQLNGAVDQLNSSAEQLLRRSLATARGKLLENFLAPEFGATLARQRAALLAGRRCPPANVTVLVANSDPRTVQSSIVLIRDWRGEPDHFVHVLSPLQVQPHERGEDDRPSFLLTRGQARILELVSAGLTDTAVAQCLRLTRDGVTHHLRRLSALLNTNTRTELVMRAVNLGLLDGSQWPPVVPSHRVSRSRQP
ncbi:PAS domain-containing protein [Lentzea sp. HUAS12]|uniref:PAS domain-containing protein n=1 Tax=Lentzea sp. HUAS12 TaxID=2951806 RepID=UPI0020A0B62B|nr:PAS domain-containing protein [Lentzea sp. HUAS12]USX56367.1 PAS domain-containing protein [Lentzea sp. HUAS12]